MEAGRIVDLEEHRMGIKRGQAMLELAFGMFALAIVVSALSGFAIYIAKSLKVQNGLRIGASSGKERVEFTTFAAKHVFGTDSLTIKERVTMPPDFILK